MIRYYVLSVVMMATIIGGGIILGNIMRMTGPSRNVLIIATALLFPAVFVVVAKFAFRMLRKESHGEEASARLDIAAEYEAEGDSQEARPLLWRELAVVSVPLAIVFGGSFLISRTTDQSTRNYVIIAFGLCLAAIPPYLVLMAGRATRKSSRAKKLEGEERRPGTRSTPAAPHHPPRRRNRTGDPLPRRKPPPSSRRPR
ncbi:hypothetical protein ACFQ08_09215 [Streptosporangium algeriense]|uniref:Uncharacterized protein n=1 Tax=Streptosporangium algeriense TaxID=1682748 RepID=A0ABW3DLG4_9ACTN